MGASKSKSGNVPNSSGEIASGITNSLANKIGGEGTLLGRSIQAAPGGKEFQQRFAGDVDFSNFFGSRNEDMGTKGTTYNIGTGVTPTTKSLRGKYLGSGARSNQIVEEIQE
jgi:hypothetical protein